ncbi:MAG: hypothetical protein P8010_04420 [Desulfosarcinaceae bacterium]|jgi:hypothetical protein
MTASGTNPPPDFFEEHNLDPVTAAARTPGKGQRAAVPKKKAGFYLSEDLLTRFDRLFHQLKIDGVPVENKSALLELALEFALADLARADESVLLRRLTQGR